MSYKVERESLKAACREVQATLRATRSTTIDEDRFQWLYGDNPDGPAVLWAARHCETGKMAGFTVCLPRRMLVSGREVYAWNGADFSILPKFRTLGVALKLRRAAKIEIDEGAVDLLYSHPNQRMQVIHERVGHKQVGKMVRYAKLIDLAGKLPTLLPKWSRNAANATLGNAATFSIKESVHKYDHDICHVPQLRFDSQFDHLFADSSHGRTLVGIRDSEYLDWRYKKYPMQSFHLITASQAGRLEGYLIYGSRNGVISVQDAFTRTSQAMMDLVVEVTRFARKQKVGSVSVQLLEESALLPILQQLGYRERVDHSHMFAYTANPQMKAEICKPNHWLIHAGDRDI